MGKLLYLEGSSGISGDMTVGALLDLGASREKLDAVLKSLHLEGFDYHISRKSSRGIEGCDFEVILHEHEHHHEHHEHEHEHHHHEHEHEHHEHHHEHRNLNDVYEVIGRGEMTDRARTLAKKNLPDRGGGRIESPRQAGRRSAFPRGRCDRFDRGHRVRRRADR